MKISKAHQKFANRLNNPIALEHPEEFLGPNWKDVLNFWLFLDTLSVEQWKTVEDRYQELNTAREAAARGAARDAALGAAYHAAHAGAASWDAAYAAARGAALAAGVAAAWATYELIGSHNILSKNKPLTFLPLFLNL